MIDGCRGSGRSSLRSGRDLQPPQALAELELSAQAVLLPREVDRALGWYVYLYAVSRAHVKANPGQGGIEIADSLKTDVGTIRLPMQEAPRRAQSANAGAAAGEEVLCGGWGIGTGEAERPRPLRRRRRSRAVV